MRYFVKFNEARTPGFFKFGAITEENGNESGKYSMPYLPDTKTTIRVVKDTNMKPFIKIEEEALLKVVPAFNFFTKEGVLIEKASLSYGTGDFWNNEDLFLDIPNSGKELFVVNPEETPVDFFWLGVMKGGDGRFYVNDGESPRPEVLSEAIFIVTPESVYDERLDRSIERDEKMEAFDFNRSLIVASREKKMYIAECIGLYYDNTTSDFTLERGIVEKINKDPGQRVFNSEEIESFVRNTLKYTQAQLDLAVLIKSAINKNILAKTGDQYYFENRALGFSAKDVETTLKKTDFASVKQKLAKAVSNYTDEQSLPGRKKT